MKACAENWSVPFKQLTSIEFLTVEGVSADETGIRSTMTVKNELGYTAK